MTDNRQHPRAAHPHGLESQGISNTTRHVHDQRLETQHIVLPLMRPGQSKLHSIPTLRAAGGEKLPTHRPKEEGEPDTEEEW